MAFEADVLDDQKRIFNTAFSLLLQHGKRVLERNCS